jgi:hypothetical protein
METRNDLPVEPENSAKEIPWMRIAAAGTLIVGGGLLLSGRRKAGLFAAATGASLALLDQKDSLGTWWRVMPGYINELQRLLGQAQETVDGFSEQREKLVKAFGEK